MSEARDIMAAVVLERQVWSADTAENLTTGESFRAEFEPIGDIELNTELGRDARESVLMHVTDRVQAAAIKLTTRIRVSLLGTPETFMVVRRSNNPADPQIEFGLMKLTEKDS